MRTAAVRLVLHYPRSVVDVMCRRVWTVSPCRAFASDSQHPSARRPLSADQCERTFIALKPDAVQRGLVGTIISRFETCGCALLGAARERARVCTHTLCECTSVLHARSYKLVGIRIVNPTRAIAERHYAGARARAPAGSAAPCAFVQPCNREPLCVCAHRAPRARLLRARVSLPLLRPCRRHGTHARTRARARARVRARANVCTSGRVHMHART